MTLPEHGDQPGSTLSWSQLRFLLVYGVLGDLSAFGGPNVFVLKCHRLDPEVISYART